MGNDDRSKQLAEIQERQDQAREDQEREDWERIEHRVISVSVIEKRRRIQIKTSKKDHGRLMTAARWLFDFLKSFFASLLASFFSSRN
jgi:hypothetical protein